jgi:hypothetical protein
MEIIYNRQKRCNNREEHKGKKPLMSQHKTRIYKTLQAKRFSKHPYHKKSSRTMIERRDHDKRDQSGDRLILFIFETGVWGNLFANPIINGAPKVHGQSEQQHTKKLPWKSSLDDTHPHSGIMGSINGLLCVRSGSHAQFQMYPLDSGTEPCPNPAPGPKRSDECAGWNIYSKKSLPV